MKRISYLLILAVSFAACQKDLSYDNQAVPADLALVAPSTASNFVTAKIGASEGTFNVNNSAAITALGNGKSLKLIASSSADSKSKETIQLFINFISGAPAVGTYTERDPEFKYVVSGFYNPNSTTVSYTAGLIPSTQEPLSITITSIDNNVIKGTFKGTFYRQDLSTGVISNDNYLNITKGEFNSPIN